MAATRATVRRWGSSLATVIPPDALKAEGLKEGDEVIIEVRKARGVRDVFGMFAGKPMNAQRIKDELRREDNE